MTERRFYVYAHRKKSTGCIFYIGKGSHRLVRVSAYERAHHTGNRGDYWNAIVAKHGFTVEVLGEFYSENEAFEFEKNLIKKLGKKSSGGVLCNLTDGGEGSCGFSPSQITRAKLSAAMSKEKHHNWGKKLSPEVCAKKSETLKNSPKNLRGKKLPQWWKDRIALAKLGELNPMYGVTGADHPQSRKVIDASSGAVFDSVNIAADHFGYKMKTLYNWLSGHRRNPTTLRFA